MMTETSSHTNKVLLSKKEVAWLLSLSVRSVDYLIVRGELAVRRVGKRVLIHRTELERFARRDHLPGSTLGGGPNSPDGTHARSHHHQAAPPPSTISSEEVSN